MAVHFCWGVCLVNSLFSCSVNIPVSGGCGSITGGSTVTPYLPPIPPKGTGFHRFVFALYTHDTPLSHTTPCSLRPTDPTHMGVARDAWLHQRGFSSAEFMAVHEDCGLKPWSFAFFQCQWDHSVGNTYKRSLRESAGRTHGA